MRNGALTIDGSDALLQGQGWMRCWLLGLVSPRAATDVFGSCSIR
jgi:hypothetical protein